MIILSFFNFYFEDVDINYFLRLTEEHWEFMMYRLNDLRTVQLMENIRANVRIIFFVEWF